jgi:hypothetical protein
MRLTPSFILNIIGKPHLHKYKKPSGWPCEPTNLPTPTIPVPHPTAQPADARAAALQAQNDAVAKYKPDNDQLGADIGTYNGANDNWNRIKFNMTQQDFNACFADLGQAYMALSTENTNITAAYEFLGVGQTYFNEAEAETNLMIKVAKYGMAKGQWDSAKNACITAEGAHTSFTTPINDAITIEGNYG